MPDRMLEYFILCLISATCCPGRRLITRGRGTLARERLDLVKQWVDEANKDATPDTVGAGSCYLATWQCGCSCKALQRITSLLASTCALAQRALVALTAVGTNSVCASPLQHCTLI